MVNHRGTRGRKAWEERNIIQAAKPTYVNEQMSFRGARHMYIHSQEEEEEDGGVQ